MKITGNDGQAYLIELEDGIGIVADPIVQQRFKPRPVESILKTGYWEQIKHDENLLAVLLKLPEVGQ